MNTKVRERIAWVLTISIIALLVANAWQRPQKTSAPAVPARPLQAREGLDEHLLAVRTKLVLGAKRYFEKHPESLPPSMRGTSQAQNPLVERLAAVFLSLGPQAVPPAPPESTALLRRRLVAAWYLGMDEEMQALAENLSARDDAAPSDVQLSSTLKSGTISQRQELETQLGWHARLVDAKTDGAAREALERESERSFKRMVVAFVLGACFFACAIMGFAFLAIQLLRGRLVSRFKDEGVPIILCLEIFAIYLALMYALPHAISLLPLPRSQAAQLFSNSAILLLVALVLYPLLHGSRFQEVRTRLGLYVNGIGGALKETLIGILSYCAAWVPLGAILLLYSALLQHLNVDVSKGTHPIVPMLLDTEDRLKIVFIVFLAAVVAPIVEEVMFRGALYSYLRARVGVMGAVLSSSLVFAVVHPQGSLGVVPLTAIAIVLALIREWRGGLLAPMVAHACFNTGTLVMLLLVMG